MTSDGGSPPSTGDPGYKYISLAGPAAEEQEEERLGCLDIATATVGLGCALFVRTIIIVLALVLLYIGLRLTGFGGDNPPTGHGPRHVFGQCLDWRPLVLAYLLYFKKEFRGGVVNEFHARIHVFK